jgi:hypothetical protein
MARLRDDNGKPADTAIKDILSPYDSDRSALADCTELGHAAFNCRKAIVIYGFDYPDRSLEPVADSGNKGRTKALFGESSPNGSGTKPMATLPCGQVVAQGLDKRGRQIEPIGDRVRVGSPVDRKGDENQHVQITQVRAVRTGRHAGIWSCRVVPVN